jgi:hypothetical protein
MQVKQVRPTLWDAIEEAQARRASLKILHLGLLGDTLTDSGLNQLGRALRELQVSKVRPGSLGKQCPVPTLNLFSLGDKSLETVPKKPDTQRD